METFHQLLVLSLPIPVWQIVLFVGLMTLFMIAHKVKLCLVTSYVFILFWLYYSFQGDLISVTRGDYVLQAVYDLFGFLLLGLSLFAYFFLEPSTEVLFKSIEKRNAEIAELKLKAREAEKNAHGLKAQVTETQQSFQTRESDIKKALEEELNAKINEIDQQLSNKQSLLEKRDGQIADLQLKAKEAEERAKAFKTQVEENQRSFGTRESEIKKTLEEALTAKIDQLEHRLEDSEGLLEKRNMEIADLKLKAEEAAKKAHALEDQVEEIQQGSRTEESTIKKKLEKKLTAKIDQLENRLEDSEGLLEKRNKEIMDLKLRAKETEKNAHGLKTQVTETQQSFQTRESDIKKKLEEKLNAKVSEFEQRLKDNESLLEKRNKEIMDLKLRAKETEKNAHGLKAQVTETQQSFQTRESDIKKKLEEKLNAKVSEFEQRLKDSESLLEKRNKEIMDLKLRAKEAEKNAYEVKSQAKKERQDAQAKNSNYKNSVEQDVKNMISGLEKQIKILDEQLKEKDGLLGLMAKRNWELADLKSKAEEKVEILEAQSKPGQQALHTEESGTSFFSSHQNAKP
jgi:chromosome segregation ATPase